MAVTPSGSARGRPGFSAADRSDYPTGVKASSGSGGRTDGLMARDAAALGQVLKIRFHPLAVESADGSTITDYGAEEILDPSRISVV